MNEEPQAEVANKCRVVLGEGSRTAAFIRQLTDQMCGGGFSEILDAVASMATEEVVELQEKLGGAEWALRQRCDFAEHLLEVIRAKDKELLMLVQMVDAMKRKGKRGKKS